MILLLTIYAFSLGWLLAFLVSFWLDDRAHRKASAEREAVRKEASIQSMLDFEKRLAVVRDRLRAAGVEVDDQ